MWKSDSVRLQIYFNDQIFLWSPIILLDDEFVVQIDPYKSKVDDYMKWFEPQQLFMNHMISTGFSVSFINKYINEEEGNEGNDSQEKLF